MVRQCNDNTMDSQATAFCTWLFSAAGYTDFSLVNMQEAKATYVLGVCVDHLACSRKNTATNLPIMAKTLVQHLTASAQFLRLATHLPVAIYANPQSSSPCLLPWLGDIIHTRQQWQQPLPKRLPHTCCMFRALHKLIQSLLASDCSTWLGCDATVFDWSCLGIFTGSCSREYAQTVAKRGQFACVPKSWAAPTEWQNTPLAFITTDFTFMMLTCGSFHPLGCQCPRLCLYPHPLLFR